MLLIRQSLLLKRFSEKFIDLIVINFFSYKNLLIGVYRPAL